MVAITESHRLNLIEDSALEIYNNANYENKIVMIDVEPNQKK